MASTDANQSGVLRNSIPSYFLAVIVSALFLTCVSAGDPFGFDQTTGTRISGREFLLALSVDNPTTGALLKVHNLASDQKASLTVTVYNDDNSSPKISHYQVSWGNIKTITVSPPRASSSSASSGPFVVNVTSSQNITLVAMRNGTASFGSYTVYPIDNAGRYYDVVSFPSASEEHQSEIIVIGVDDVVSDVTFQSPRNFTVHGSNADSYQLSSIEKDNVTISYTAIGMLGKAHAVIFRSTVDLTSATVTANPDGGRVVVISSSYCPTEPCDVLTEQIPPIQTLGRSHFIVPTRDYAGTNLFRILSPWPNTTVTTDSLQAMNDETNTQSFPFSSGDYFDIDPDGSIQNMQSIQASKPIIVMHYLIKSDDPLIVASMTLIPPVEQFTSGNTSFSTYNVTSNPGPSITNFVNIITKCDTMNFVLLNRLSIQGWTNCPPLNDGGPSYCAIQKQLKEGQNTLEPHPAHMDTKFSAVQYGIRTDKSAFANTVFMSFREVTCNVSKGGIVIPCKDSKPTTTPATITTILPTSTRGAGNMTTLLSTLVPGTIVSTTANSTNMDKSSARQKAGTVLAICIGIITLIAAVVALIVIANAAFGKRSKWKRLHNQATDNSITLDSVSV